MHSLHKILVWVGKRCINDSREQIMEEARRAAENATEQYDGTVYDWWTTDTAGRWEEKYKENVMLSADDIDRFVSELEEAMECQKKMIQDHLECVVENAGTSDLRALVSLAAGKNIPAPSWTYSLNAMSNLLYGEYIFDSEFYDAEEFTGKITEEKIERVKRSPDEWALVFFDMEK